MTTIWLMIVANTTVRILTALAPFAWPISAIFIARLFKPQIGELVGKIKSISAGGNTVEMHTALENLSRTVESASEDAQTVVLPPVTATADQMSGGTRQEAHATSEVITQNDNRDPISDFEAARQSIIRTAQSDKPLAIISLSINIERKTRDVLSLRDPNPGRPFASLRQLADRLEANGYPSTLSDSVRQFAVIRNRIVHGERITEAEATRALGLGLELLEILNSIE